MGIALGQSPDHGDDFPFLPFFHRKFQDLLFSGHFRFGRWGALAVGQQFLARITAGRAVKLGPFKKSHHDPVYDVNWNTGSRAGNEFFSCSSDGRILWWDCRDLNKPTD